MFELDAKIVVRVAPLFLAACTVHLPPIAPAPHSPAPLAVYVDPDPTIGTTVEEEGRAIIPVLHDAVAKSLGDAGYKVLPDRATKADMVVHMTIAKVGATRYGTAVRPWASHVALDVFGDGQTLTRVKRWGLNWSDYEGDDQAQRVQYAANDLVNELSLDPKVIAFASGHAPAAAPSPH